MPRFTDNWVVDRTMFEYVSGGSCACCGFPHLFHPNGLKGLIEDISDLETDAADAEFRAAQKSPWPPDMRDQVWADRVKLRMKMKKEMRIYKLFLEEEIAQQQGGGGGSGSGSSGVDGFKYFCRSILGPAGLRRALQMPRAEISERLSSQYGIHSAFAIVLCAVVEQVANFEATELCPDGRSEVELEYERLLRFDKRGGFVLPVAERDASTREYVVDEYVLDVFARLVQSLGGPKLLHRAPPKRRRLGVADGKEAEGSGGEDEEDDEEDGGGADGGMVSETLPGRDGPSFRSDRRIVRLMIARYWADQVIAKYRAHVKEEEEKRRKEEKIEVEEKKGTAEVEG